MPTISQVCANLFTDTNLAKLEKKPTRATRRNMARVMYRKMRRPGVYNPEPKLTVQDEHGHWDIK